MAAPAAKSYILGLSPYVPGRAKVDGVEKVVKLSSNECVYGASPKALDAFGNTSPELLRYPDAASNALRDVIAETHNLPVDNLICGAGSDEILTLLIHSYAGPGDEIIHSRFGFMVYAIQGKAAGATPVAVKNKDWAANVDGILAAVTENTKLIFVDNPCNPTGAYLPWSEVERLHAGLRDDILLVLDAAYAECATAEDYQAGEALVKSSQNVVMTRTLSKQYALAGLRVGWAYGPDHVIDILNRVRMPFNVNVPAQAAAIEALKDKDHLEASVAFNARERDKLTAALSAMGLEIVPSQTNFVLIGFPKEAPHRAEDANMYLTKMGYILRWLPGQGLGDYLRLTIGTEEQNNAVIELIRAFLNDGDMIGHNS